MSREDFIVGQIRAAGISTVINGITVNVKMRDEVGDVLICTGTTKPTDGSSGYAKGCIFIDTNVETGTTGFYTNDGTNTSCSFIQNMTAGSVAAEVSELTSIITSINTDRASDESVLQSQITSDATSESVQNSKLDSEISDRAIDESLVVSQLTSEIDDRTLDESVIVSQLTSEISDRAIDESVLQSSLTSESTARAAGDSQLLSTVDSEISDRGADESTLQSEVTSGDLRISILESKVASHA